MAPEPQRNVKWIDGLRGMASFMVIITHLTRAWDLDLFMPKSAEGATPRLLQLPLLRIAPQGRIGVTIFAFLTGYVCALKPIRQARAGDPEAALSTVAKSAFRRGPRLIIPATIITVGAAVLAQLGAFTVARRTDSLWIFFGSPEQKSSIFDAIYSVIYNALGTWTKEHNEYDLHQWTLLPLLKGSMMIYIVLFGTVYMKSTYRMAVSAGLYIYYYLCGDATFGMQFFFGMFLSDLSNHPPAMTYMSVHRWLHLVVSPFLIIIGLYFASYPQDHPEWSAWSSALLRLSEYIFPVDTDVPRFYTGLGLNFIVLGIQLSPVVKELFASKALLWFGKHSFAVYLLHGTLMRTVLIWMLYGTSVPPGYETMNDMGEIVPPATVPMRGRTAVFISLPIWLAIVYGCAYLWTTHVDSAVARFTQRLEKRVFEEREKSAGLLTSLNTK